MVLSTNPAAERNTMYSDGHLNTSGDFCTKDYVFWDAMTLLTLIPPNTLARGAAQPPAVYALRNSPAPSTSQTNKGICLDQQFP